MIELAPAVCSIAVLRERGGRRRRDRGWPEHPSLAYAETIVAPAAVGAYSVRQVGIGPARVIKAFVRQANDRRSFVNAN